MLFVYDEVVIVITEVRKFGSSINVGFSLVLSRICKQQIGNKRLQEALTLTTNIPFYIPFCNIGISPIVYKNVRGFVFSPIRSTEDVPTLVWV